MSWITVVAGIPPGIAKWLVDVVRASETYIRLRNERERLRGLEDFRNQQLAALRGGNSNLLTPVLESVLLNVNTGRAEPHVVVQIRIFNGSMFTMQFSNWRFRAEMDGKFLSLASTASNPNRLPPGGNTVLTFIQPIQDSTRDHILRAVQIHDLLAWSFEASADCRIQETSDTISFNPNPLSKQEVPRLP